MAVDAASFQEDLDFWRREDWHERLREKLARVPGLCVLDLVEGNILSFSQGDWGLVERDVLAAFSEELATLILECFRDEVQTCLTVRRELINFKKLCLHLWQTASSFEKDLRQLASFFYCRVAEQAAAGEAPETLPRRQSYITVSNALSECRGAVAAVFDARHFSKAICALPRHPASGVPWKFEALPESLELWKTVDQARHFLENYKAFDTYFAAMHGESGESSEAAVKPVKSQRQAAGVRANPCCRTISPPVFKGEVGWRQLIMTAISLGCFALHQKGGKSMFGVPVWWDLVDRT